MTDVMRARQQYYVDTVEILRGGAIARVTWDQLYERLDGLSEGLPLAMTQFVPVAKIGRGRILDSSDKFNTIAELSYPPKEKCKTFGRCNCPGAPIFYGGVGTELIFSEIGAKIGDYVGLLHVSPVKELLCVRLGALDLWRRTSGEFPMGEELKSWIKEKHSDPNNIVMFILDAFFRDYFSRPGSHDVYKLTSAITSAILNSHQDISGLIYDSVDHTAGACLALKPEVADHLLKPTEAQIVRITSYLGYGIYDFEQIAFANAFDGKDILWN